MTVLCHLLFRRAIKKAEKKKKKSMLHIICNIVGNLARFEIFKNFVRNSFTNFNACQNFPVHQVKIEIQVWLGMEICLKLIAQNAPKLIWSPLRNTFYFEKPKFPNLLKCILQHSPLFFFFGGGGGGGGGGSGGEIRKICSFYLRAFTYSSQY